MGFSVSRLISTIPDAVIGYVKVVYRLIKSALESRIANLYLSILSGRLPLPFEVYDAAREMRRLRSLLITEGRTIRHRRKPEEVSKRLQCELALKSAPSKEAYFQILAQNASYVPWERGAKLPRSEAFMCPEFEVRKVFHFPDGITGMVVVPTSRRATDAPMIVFRGTDASNIHNLADDFNVEIGALNVSKYGRELHQEIETLACEFSRRIHVLGHSYGGAVAQRLTAKFPQYIERLTYYNAPKVGREAVREYRQKVSEMERYMPKPEVYSYRHVKDVVSLVGTEAIPADRGRAITSGLMDDGVSFLDAHGFNTLSTGAIHIPEGDSPYEMHRFAQWLEEGRQEAARIIPFYRELRKLF